jgi:hypothetical protein
MRYNYIAYLQRKNRVSVENLCTVLPLLLLLQAFSYFLSVIPEKLLGAILPFRNPKQKSSLSRPLCWWFPSPRVYVHSVTTRLRPCAEARPIVWRHVQNAIQQKGALQIALIEDTKLRREEKEGRGKSGPLYTQAVYLPWAKPLVTAPANCPLAEAVEGFSAGLRQ